MSDQQDFVIENGVLKKYNGPGGEVVIPAGVEKIGSNAFQHCISMSGIALPDSVTEIGGGAFQSCTGLTQIVLPDGVTKIGSGAFFHCTGLTQIALPSSVTEIEASTFQDCTSLPEITLPDRLTEIGAEAFRDCTSLTSLTIPDSVTKVGGNAFAGTPWLAQQKQNNKIVYVGQCVVACRKDLSKANIREGTKQICAEAFKDCSGLREIILPVDVTEIGISAFEGCTALTRVTLPEKVEEVGYRAFFGCSNLAQMVLTLDQLSMSQRMFQPNAKTVELFLRVGDGEPLDVIASFRKEYFMQSWDYPKEYLVPLEPEDIPVYDRLVASGKYEGFQMNEDGRIKAMLLRLQDTERPVSEEFRGMFADFLSGKASKVIKLAEKEKNAAYVHTLISVGVVDGANRKRVKKHLAASDLSELRELAEKLDQEPPAVRPQKGNGAVEQKYLDRLRKVNARGVLLKYGIQDVPAVHLAEGGALAPPEYLTLCLAEYLKQQSKWSEELCPLADEAAAKLDRQELVQALLSLYEKAAPESNRAAFLPVLFRYTDGETMGKLYREYRSMWKMGDFADHALLFSDTREAVIYAEKGNLLRRYAALRKMDEETIRVTKLLNFDLDTAGKKVYDLGEDTVTVVLEPDLTLTLSSANGKAIKSLPKKGSDPEKYESAKADFSEMKKNLKKAVRARFDGLFQDFLSGREMDGAVWAESNLTNPLMRQSASLLVWSQEGKTFTLQEGQPVDSEGHAYSLTDAPIQVAHPMEMRRKDLERWQRYFTSRVLKQPFAQIWEPVIDFSQIKEDRYQGVEIPAYRFKGQEKHGIKLEIHLDRYEADVHLDDCRLRVDSGALFDNLLGLCLNHSFTLLEFEYRKRSRAANHIIGLLDKWTVYGRVLKDDVSVVEQLDRFTLAQVTELLNLAIENHCTNCTAALLEYKNRKFPDFDPMDVFTLE